MFSQKELEARVAQANQQFVSGEEVPNAPPNPNAKPEEVRQIGTGKDVPMWAPIDILQHNRNKRIIDAKKQFPKGSRALVSAVAKDVIDGEGHLACAKKKAEDDIDSLKQNGYKDRAEIMARQYMEEKFLPAIETVIHYTSPDELLNNKEALAALDKMALGVGSMTGYTAAYVRQAYGDQLGQKPGESDPTVVSEMRRIRMLVEGDQMRTAIGMAKKLKEQIDNGEHASSQEDYAVLGRMVAYAN